jgi:putative oxidoreductase
MCADNLIDQEAFMRKLLATVNDYTLTLMRLVLGVVFFLHGSQKMLGWFGGFGFSGTMNFFTSQLHIPAVVALLAICAEFFGGLGLIVGFLARIAAFGIAVNMLVWCTFPMDSL